MNLSVTDNPNIYIDNANTTSLLIYGSSRSGKTSLIINLIDRFLKDHIIVVFSPNIVSTAYPKDRFKNVIYGQYFQPELIKMAHRYNNKTNNSIPFIFILDDVLDQRNSTVLNDLMLSYRNSRISCIVSLQYPKLVKPGVRSNAANIAYFAYSDRPFLEELTKTHFGSLLGPNTESRIAAYTKMTTNHNYIWKNSMTDDPIKFSLHNTLPFK